MYQYQHNQDIIKVYQRSETLQNIKKMWEKLVLGRLHQIVMVK